VWYVERIPVSRTQLVLKAHRHGPDYAFVVIAVTFSALLATAGLRSTPGVLIVPLEHAFGWRRDVISLAAAVGIFLFGLVGPFAAALMQKIGVRRTMLVGLALMSASSAASAFMTRPWHLVLTWGVLSGLGSGCVGIVLGAASAAFFAGALRTLQGNYVDAFLIAGVAAMLAAGVVLQIRGSTPALAVPTP
jgi:MFS family permease